MASSVVFLRDWHVPTAGRSNHPASLSQAVKQRWLTHRAPHLPGCGGAVAAVQAMHEHAVVSTACTPNGR